MPLSFGTLKRRKQWPIFRTKEAPGLKEYRKRDNGWKNRKKNRLQNENIERQDKKWVFEANLMVNIKEIKGDFMVDSLHLPLFPLY